MRLGVLIASAPTEGDAPLVASAVEAALLVGDSIELFLMADGVHYALTASMRAYLAAGADVTVCAMDAEAHGLDPAQLTAIGVTLGSQRDHAHILLRCDRFLSFT